MTDALDTQGAVEKVSKEAGILLIMLLAGGVALYVGWDQISAVFSAQQSLQRAVEDLSELEHDILLLQERIGSLEKKETQYAVDMMLLRREVESNSFFSKNWPLGKIGSLPDDIQQNMRLDYLERDVELLKEK